MGDFYNLESVGNRNFPSGLTDEPPGICLERGFLPPEILAGSLVYALITGVKETGEVIPAPTSAVDPQTGKVVEPGEIVVIDLDKPEEIYKEVGAFVLLEGEIAFVSHTGL